MFSDIAFWFLRYGIVTLKINLFPWLKHKRAEWDNIFGYQKHWKYENTETISPYSLQPNLDIFSHLFSLNVTFEFWKLLFSIWKSQTDIAFIIRPEINVWWRNTKSFILGFTINCCRWPKSSQIESGTFSYFYLKKEFNGLWKGDSWRVNLKENYNQTLTSECSDWFSPLINLNSWHSRRLFPEKRAPIGGLYTNCLMLQKMTKIAHSS